MGVGAEFTPVPARPSDEAVEALVAMMLVELRKYKKKGTPKTRITKYNLGSRSTISSARPTQRRQMPFLTATA